VKGAINFLAVVSCLVLGGASAYAALQDGWNVSRLFEKADVNHDGVLTREEAAKVPALASQFNDMDINQDGKVTHQEMVASMKMKKKHHESYTKKSLIGDGRQ